MDIKSLIKKALDAAVHRVEDIIEFMLYKRELS